MERRWSVTTRIPGPVRRGQSGELSRTRYFKRRQSALRAIAAWRGRGMTSARFDLREMKLETIGGFGAGWIQQGETERFTP